MDEETGVSRRSMFRTAAAVGLGASAAPAAAWMAAATSHRQGQHGTGSAGTVHPVASFPPVDPVSRTGRPFIWFEPHQDDGLLWAWKILTHHALTGRDVHVVLATDGSASRIRHVLNGETSNRYWGRHYPDREGYGHLTPMSPKAFAKARDRELKAACGPLGIVPENLHLELDWRQAKIDVPRARELITRYADLYPDAGLCTMWWRDTDPCHSALGTALRQLHLADPARFPDCRWVVRRKQGPTAPGAVPYQVPERFAATAHQMAKNASLAYSSWAPGKTEDDGMYAIGLHSVGSDLAAVKRGEPNWVVDKA
ncbi:PIG-L family deacetylase [Streptomyces sp. IBSBF 2953]|uniref:PIG-L family deacetylase n=1 Tax=Streptomyces TaxID=1883 RepID=UPI00211A7407|nr:PIG-L family deacetylase [Streptomyces scabiei]MCQ9180162.1 PIG-L family deacetylase [Streptomyces hayashii]MDX3112466.1 PIG-L family deacetylase [Streptomyces scabiei]